MNTPPNFGSPRRFDTGAGTSGSPKRRTARDLHPVKSVSKRKLSTGTCTVSPLAKILRTNEENEKKEKNLQDIVSSFQRAVAFSSAGGLSNRIGLQRVVQSNRPTFSINEMAHVETDSDGFTYVSRKRRGKQHHCCGQTVQQSGKLDTSLPTTAIHRDILIDKIVQARDSVRSMDFYSQLRDSLMDCWTATCGSTSGLPDINREIEPHSRTASIPGNLDVGVLEPELLNHSVPKSESETLNHTELITRSLHTKSVETVSETTESSDHVTGSTSETIHVTGLRSDNRVTVHSCHQHQQLRRDCRHPSQQAHGETSRPRTVVCYGLGNFGDCVTARYQLALLLNLLKDLQVPVNNCHVYDPKFTSTESQTVEEFGLQSIGINEEGKRVVGGPTLFYMPHCGKCLYNNLLWANWSPDLSQVLLIGNSFSRMVTSTPKRLLMKSAEFVMKIQSHTQEVKFPSTFPYSDVFNDLAIHSFPADRLSRFPPEFWCSCGEPEYDDDDVEIITNKISSVIL